MACFYLLCSLSKAQEPWSQSTGVERRQQTSITSVFFKNVRLCYISLQINFSTLSTSSDIIHYGSQNAKGYLSKQFSKNKNNNNKKWLLNENKIHWLIGIETKLRCTSYVETHDRNGIVWTWVVVFCLNICHKMCHLGHSSLLGSS